LPIGFSSFRFCSNESKDVQQTGRAAGLLPDPTKNRPGFQGPPELRETLPSSGLGVALSAILCYRNHTAARDLKKSPERRPQHTAGEGKDDLDTRT
jgi:hypothetical protein